jgi:hypothetical protein
LPPVYGNVVALTEIKLDIKKSQKLLWVLRKELENNLDVPFGLEAKVDSNYLENTTL